MVQLDQSLDFRRLGSSKLHPDFSVFCVLSIQILDSHCKTKVFEIQTSFQTPLNYVLYLNFRQLGRVYFHCTVNVGIPN